MKGTHLLLIVNTSTCCGNGAPPNKLRVLYRLLHSYTVVTARLMFQGYHSLVHGIISFF